MQKKYYYFLLYLLLIAACALVLTAPASINGYLSGHDHPVHIKWYTHFSSQLFNGELYPRWLAGMNAGMGSPAFFFYGPIPYYMTAFIDVVTPLSNIPHILGLSVALALFLSGLTFFLWIRGAVDHVAALAGSLVYMALPYHVLIDVYERFAFAEVWAFAWMPLILMSTERIGQGLRYGIITFAVTYSLLVLTHLPTTLIFSPLPAFYLLYICPRHLWLHRITTFIAAAGLGISLSSLYLATAMLTQGHISIETMTKGSYQAIQNFLFYGPRYELADAEYIKYWVLLSQVTLVAISVAVAGYLVVWGKNYGNQPLLFWLGVSIVTVLMTTPISRFIWNTVSILQSIQFPARFNVVLTVSAAATFSYGLHIVLNGDRSRWRLVLPTCVFFLLVLLYIPQSKSLYWKLSTPFVPRTNWFYNSFEMDEYRPQWVPISNWQRLGEAPIPRSEPGTVFVRSGQGTVVLNPVSSREYLLRIAADTELTLVVHQFFYPGWTVFHEKGSTITINAEADWGLIQFKVPPGNYTATLKLDMLPQEKIGLIFSISSMILILMIWVFARRLTPSTL